MKGIISLVIATLIISAYGDSSEKPEWEALEKLRQENALRKEKILSYLRKLGGEQAPAKSNYEQFLLAKKNYNVESDDEITGKWRPEVPPGIFSLLEKRLWKLRNGTNAENRNKSLQEEESDGSEDSEDSKTLGDIGGGSSSQDEKELPAKNRPRRSSSRRNRVEQNSSDTDEDSDSTDDNSSDEESRCKHHRGKSSSKKCGKEKDSDESNSSDDKSSDSDSNEKKSKDSRKSKSKHSSSESDSSDDKSSDSDSKEKKSKDSRKSKSKHSSSESDSSDDKSSDSDSKEKKSKDSRKSKSKHSSSESDSSDDKSSDSESNEKKSKDSRKSESESNDRSSDDKTEDSKDSRKDKSRGKSSDGSNSDSSDSSDTNSDDRKGGKDAKENWWNNNKKGVEGNQKDEKNNLNGDDKLPDDDIPWYWGPEFFRKLEMRKQEFRNRLNQINELRKVIESLKNNVSGYDDRWQKERIARLNRVVSLKKSILGEQIRILRGKCNITTDGELESIIEEIDICKINYSRLNESRRKFYELKRLREKQNASDANSVVDTGAGIVVTHVLNSQGDLNAIVVKGEEEAIPSQPETDIIAEASVNKEVRIEADSSSNIENAFNKTKNNSDSSVDQSAISISTGTINITDTVLSNADNEISNDDAPADDKYQQSSDPKSDKPKTLDPESEGDKISDTSSVIKNSESLSNSEIQIAADADQIAVSIDAIELSANQTQNSDVESEVDSKPGESSIDSKNDNETSIEKVTSAVEPQISISTSSPERISTPPSEADGTTEPSSPPTGPYTTLDSETDDSESEVAFNTVGSNSTPLIDK